MPAETYGVLLLSFSRHSHQSSFVPLYQNHPRIRIIAVADEPDIEPELREADRQWANRLGVPYVEDIDQALALGGVDIVSIGHEIERRARLALRAAAAGKHLWIDKFLGADMPECDAVVAGIQAAGVKSIVPNYTYGQLARQCGEMLSDGRLGRLLGVHADIMFGKGWPRPISPDPGGPHFLPPGRWKFPDIKRELLTVGAYAVGLIQTCLSPIAQVWGQAGAYFFPEHAARGAEDFATLTLTDREGRVATLCGGRIGVAAHPHGGASQAYLIGTRGSVLVDARRPLLDTFLRQEIAGAEYQPSSHDPMQWHSSPPVQSSPLLPDPTGLAAGLEDLVEALDQDRMPAYTAREARDHMEVLLAGYLSVMRGETVELPLGRGETDG